MGRLTLMILLFLAFQARAQDSWQRAYLGEDGSIQVEPFSPVTNVPTFRDNDAPPGMEGFPQAAVANKIFKNFRNVTLINLDGMPGEEILWTADNMLMASTASGLLWARELTGIGIYPPSVADLDGDGDLEIVQVTGGQEGGKVYVLDKLGNDRPGWPLSFDDNWIAAAPALADVDGDSFTEIIVNELQATDGLVHLLRHDGSSFSADWPVRLDARPSVTPSAADHDGDGNMEIAVFSTRSRYLLDLQGQPLPGWPQTTHPMQRYSYQSPTFAVLREGDGLSLVGATHGEGEDAEPQFFALDMAGNFRPGWPHAIPDNTPTFQTPTVVEMPGIGPAVIAARPLSSGRSDDMLYGYNGDGEMLPGFPIIKEGGLEGIISVGDIDGDGGPDLVFGSNLVDERDSGFIHAYQMTNDEVSELPGFPLRTRGFTFMNGAALGDVNGDDSLDLVALSYIQRFGLGPDSIYLNVFELGVKIEDNTILWGTYKGDNTRRGLAGAGMTIPVRSPSLPHIDVTLSPNPAGERISVELSMNEPVEISLLLIAANGKVLKQRRVKPGSHSQREEFALNNLPSGAYWISVSHAGKVLYSVPFIHR